MHSKKTVVIQQENPDNFKPKSVLKLDKRPPYLSPDNENENDNESPFCNLRELKSDFHMKEEMSVTF